MEKKHLYDPGDRVGRLTLVRRVRKQMYGAWQIFWVCHCDCGIKKAFRQCNIASGHTKSCGCLRREMRENNRAYNIGDKVGRLTLLRRITKNRKGGLVAFWEYRCDCGTKSVVWQTNLISGHTRSCGCLQKERTAAAQTVHGESHGTTEWNIWRNMIRRCEKRSDPYYKDYGGRGIRVCAKWRKSYKAFLSDVGRRPSKLHTLNRKDNNKGYSPGNVNWATYAEQMRNKRNNVVLEINGIKKTATDWALASNVNIHTVFSRLSRGWEPERALTAPVNENISRATIRMNKRRKCEGRIR